MCGSTEHGTILPWGGGSERNSQLRFGVSCPLPVLYLCCLFTPLFVERLPAFPVLPHLKFLSGLGTMTDFSLAFTSQLNEYNSFCHLMLTKMQACYRELVAF